MKILKLKHILSISFIILIAILCLSFIEPKERETEKIPRRAILVFDWYTGGSIGG